MAKKIYSGPSRTLMEYRLLPSLSDKKCTIDEIKLRTPLVYSKKHKNKYFLNVPLVSAAMQSVSGVKMAVELTKLGGSSFIYCSQPIKEQTAMIKSVKSHKAGFVKPHTISRDTLIEEVYKIRKEKGFSTFPVIDENKQLLGFLNKYDYDPSLHSHLRAEERMSPLAKFKVGLNITDLKEANSILMESHQHVLPIINSKKELLYLVFRKDIQDHLNNPNQVVDENKRLLAVGAINTHDYRKRVKLLAEAGVDVLAIDSSDGYTVYQKETLDWIRKNYAHLPVIAGNVITAEGFKYLVKAGAAAVKVGMGGGSICITQEQKGTGRGLATSIIEVAKARDKYFKKTDRYMPIIADGGIVTAKDIVIALALGADYVMMGRYFARMYESPTKKVVLNNRVMKPYWGEGSQRAQDWKKVRYNQGKFVEGIEGFVEYAGRLRNNIDEVLTKIKATMSTCGVNSIEELHLKAELEIVSRLSIREGKPHDVYLPGEGTRRDYQAKEWGE